MSTSSDVRLDELILLDSMFPKQLSCHQPQVQEAINQQNQQFVYEKIITCTFMVDTKLEINISLPVDYPDSRLLAHCRVLDGNVPNSVQKEFNESLNNQDKNECDVVSVVQKVHDLWHDFLLNYNQEKSNNNKTQDNNESLHVYNNGISIYYFILQSLLLFTNFYYDYIRVECKSLSVMILLESEMNPTEFIVIKDCFILSRFLFN